MIELTAVTLALMTLAIILLGIFWLRVPLPLRSFLVRAAIAAIILHAALTATHWGIAYDRLDVLIKWLGVAGYEILLMLFARMSPRWLTSICAFILMLPVFASSVMLPLITIFDPVTYLLYPFAKNYAYLKHPWGQGEGATSKTGVEITIYYRPHLLPFLRQDRQVIFFSNQQCNTDAAYVLPGPRPKTVLARCPRWPSQPPGTEDQIVPLP